jgi:S-(hydroxymethyl)glutathione dehydrogenase/alcohol dehydrogenase
LKTEAALLVETGKPLVLAQIEIPPLKPGQVLVDIAYSGACHTQVLEARGHKGPDAWVPHCLGHEGSGTVLETGPGVTRVKAGDKVILSWLKGAGMEAGGTVYDWDGKKVNSGGVVTFGRQMVASENRLTPLPAGMDMKTAIMMGCALPTGMGAVLNVCEARPGQAIAIFGSGGIGLSAILGAVVSGCVPVIAVDINPQKLELAKQMGATHVVNASSGDAVKAISDIVPGGVDFAVEATGVPAVMLQAMQAVKKQGGRAVVCGNAHAGTTVNIDPRLFNDGKSIMGTWGGDSVPERDFPRYARLLMAGKLKVTPLLSKPYRLADINAALDDLEAGRVGRPLIDMSAQ